MNKAELVEAVASDAGVSRSEAEGVLNSFFETVKGTTKGGGEVRWPGFGKFHTTSRAARTARNPRTGEAVKVKASTGIKFAPSSVLKTFLNTKGTAKKSAAKKTAASTSTASRATASKATAKKATARTSTASTATAKRAPASKAAAKRAPAKKAAAEKAPTRKAAATKTTAKKSPAKRATSRSS